MKAAWNTHVEQANRQHAPPRLGRRVCLGAFSVLFLGAVAACGEAVTPLPATRESIFIVSPPETMPLVRELAESFSKARSGVDLDVTAASPADALNDLYQGRAAIAVVLGRFEGDRRLWTPTEIARQPISVIVHHDNTIKALTLDMLGNIYSGRTNDWREPGGPAMPIMPLGREPGAPIRARFDDIILGAGSRLTPNALILPSDEAMVATVARRPEAIGYMAGAVALTSVRTLAIEGETPAGLARGRAYPLWQAVNLASAASPTGAVAALIAYSKSKQGQRIIAAWGYGQGGDGL